jgi:circadian clock protein KaiB
MQMAMATDRNPAAAAPDDRLVLRLYVAGDGPNSTAARVNLKRMLGARSPDSYTVEIVDCLAEPLRAIEDGILVTPTLLRLTPPPRRTVVGSLSEADRVNAALSLVPAMDPTPHS